jgi:hypothetical protein
MHKLPMLGSLWLLLPVAAQSPLTTTFASSTFLAATTGVTVYFDLNVRTAVQINQIDVNFFGAAGPQVRIEVWTRNGTHIGNNTSNVGWTQAGVSSTVTSNGRNVPTPMPFAAPIVLQPGVNGIAVQHFGAGAAYTAGTGVGNVFSSTAEMDFIQGGASNPPIFGGTQNAPRVMNCSIHYTPLGGFAAASTYGTGCGGVAEFASYYQNFPSRTFDLGGGSGVNSILHLRLSNGYLAVQGTGNWFVPQGPSLGLAGNTVSPAQALGFAFPTPSGNTSNNVWICDDGYLWLDSPGIADFTPAVNELLNQGARLAPCWMSLDPNLGAIHFDVDPSQGAAYVTWLGVAETGNPSATITMQVALFQNGDFEFRYGAESIGTLSNSFAMVGMSPGGGRLDPGNRDISASLPFQTMPDRVLPNLGLRTTGRPVLGTSIVLETVDLPAAAPLGVTIFSFTKNDPGLDLTGLGMPGCRQYVGLDASLLFLPAGGIGSQSFQVPNVAGFAGVSVKSQSAAFIPGFNPLGVISSNGIELLLNPL